MVNNLRYHGHDVTIVWDPDGTKYGLGAGYSLFIDGERKVSTDKLGRFTYDPNTNEVDAERRRHGHLPGRRPGRDFPTAVDTPIEDDRVVSYLKTAGIDLTEDAAEPGDGRDPELVVHPAGHPARPRGASSTRRASAPAR